MNSTEMEEAFGRISDCLDQFDSSVGVLECRSGHDWVKSLCATLFNLTQQEAVAFPILSVVLTQRYRREFFVAACDFLRQCLHSWEDVSGVDEHQSATAVRLFAGLGLAELCREEVLRLIHDRMTAYVKETITGVYDQTFSAELVSWVDDALGLFVSSLYPVRSEAESLMSTLRSRMLMVLVTTRAGELFDVVADFPDSMTAIKELRDVANSTNSLHIVGKLFCKSLKRRLLHIGASTQQILDMYVSVIRSLRILDPSDMLLNFVTKPVRKYLRDRKDTVRTIVTSLVQSKHNETGESSELYGELKKGGGSLSFGVASDDEDGGPAGMNFEEWQPAKRHPDISYSHGRGYDILALLVSIYESTDLFVSEYRSLLSEKLLQSTTYDGDAEISTLEFLKMRFGDESLHSCEVILHDLEESRRNNTVLSSEIQQKSALDEKSQFPIDFLVISDNYWPALTDRLGNSLELQSIEDNSVKHHPILQNKIKQYSEVFETLKKPRKLYPVTEMGQVDLDLNFDDGSTRSFSVTPAQASLILHLADGAQSSMTSSELASSMQMEEAEARHIMSFWVSKYVVSVQYEESLDDRSNLVGGVHIYRVIEDQAANATRDCLEDTLAVDYENDAIADNTIAKTQEKECERFIVGMLSNKEAMPLERVHTMLRLVTSGSNDARFTFDMNLVQFKRFMQNLCDAAVLELVESGSYRLPRSSAF